MQVWECERYEGTTWSVDNLADADGQGWKNSTMLRDFYSIDAFESTMQEGSKWISSKWFLETGMWE